MMGLKHDHLVGRSLVHCVVPCWSLDERQRADPNSLPWSRFLHSTYTKVLLRPVSSSFLVARQGLDWNVSPRMYVSKAPLCCWEENFAALMPELHAVCPSSPLLSHCSQRGSERERTETN